MFEDWVGVTIFFFFRGGEVVSTPLHAMSEKQLNMAQFFIAQNEMIVSLN